MPFPSPQIKNNPMPFLLANLAIDPMPFSSRNVAFDPVPFFAALKTAIDPVPFWGAGGKRRSRVKRRWTGAISRDARNGDRSDAVFSIAIKTAFDRMKAMKIDYAATVAPTASVLIEVAEKTPQAVNLVVQIVLAITALISLFKKK